MNFILVNNLTLLNFPWVGLYSSRLVTGINKWFIGNWRWKKRGRRGSRWSCNWLLTWWPTWTHEPVGSRHFSSPPSFSSFLLLFLLLFLLFSNVFSLFFFPLSSSSSSSCSFSPPHPPFNSCLFVGFLHCGYFLPKSHQLPATSRWSSSLLKSSSVLDLKTESTFPSYLFSSFSLLIDIQRLYFKSDQFNDYNSTR